MMYSEPLIEDVMFLDTLIRPVFHVQGGVARSEGVVVESGKGKGMPSLWEVRRLWVTVDMRGFCSAMRGRHCSGEIEKVIERGCEEEGMVGTWIVPV